MYPTARKLAAFAVPRREPEISPGKLAARRRFVRKTRTAIARAARNQLVRLKQTYLLEGFSEADIDTVIPDRPAQAATPIKPPPRRRRGFVAPLHPRQQ